VFLWWNIKYPYTGRNGSDICLVSKRFAIEKLHTGRSM
jgi:hypothetical protein